MYCSNTGVKQTPKQKSTQKVDPGEVNSPTTSAGYPTHHLSVWCSTTALSLLPTTRTKAAVLEEKPRFLQTVYAHTCAAAAAAIQVLYTHTHCCNSSSNTGTVYTHTVATAAAIQVLYTHMRSSCNSNTGTVHTHTAATAAAIQVLYTHTAATAAAIQVLYTHMRSNCNT